MTLDTQPASQLATSQATAQPLAPTLYSDTPHVLHGCLVSRAAEGEVCHG